MNADGNDLTRTVTTRLGSVVKGKWRLDSVLGTGGMASVYLGTHRNGSRVAIKILHTQLAGEGEILSRFLREGYLANKVDHAGVVHVLDDDVTEDGSAFLVMELLDGQSFDKLLADGPLTLAEALRLTRLTLDVLAAAHEKQIVHRDIKPENVFRLRDGSVKVLDFGIARLRELAGSSGGTLGGMVLGTPAFMPPEQARGRWEDVDGQSDVWAMGATLLTLLTGKRVREAETINEELLLAMSHPLPAAASLLPTIPAAVALVIDRALAFDKKQRWPSARAMQDAVRAAEMSLAGRESDTLAVPSGRPLPMPVVITPSPRSHPASAPAAAKSRAAVVLGVLAVSALAIAIGIAGMLFLSRSRSAARVTTEPVAAGSARPAPSTLPEPPTPSAVALAVASAPAAMPASSSPAGVASVTTPVVAAARSRRGGASSDAGARAAGSDNPLDRGRY